MAAIADAMSSCGPDQRVPVGRVLDRRRTRSAEMPAAPRRPGTARWVPLFGGDPAAPDGAAVALKARNGQADGIDAVVQHGRLRRAGRSATRRAAAPPMSR